MSIAPSLPSLTVEQVAIDDLRPDPANPRRISDDELDALERSLRQFGFVQPVLARREDRSVIGGHERLVAARRLGLTTVPVTWLDVSVEQARLLGLALNKIGGSWDEQLLARLIADLKATPDVDLSLSGFDEDEIGDLLRKLEIREKREHVESFDLDEALEEARRAPRTKPGDLWVLGDHRLLCGDATSAEDVARLLDGAEPRLLTTDPPYGVSLDGAWRDGVYNALGPAEKTYMRVNGQSTPTTPHKPPVALVGEPGAIATPRCRAIRGSTGVRRSPSCHPSPSGTSGMPGSMRPRWPRASRRSASRSWPR
jgi:ParB-like chromosome segregation protein Spo0J